MDRTMTTISIQQRTTTMVVRIVFIAMIWTLQGATAFLPIGHTVTPSTRTPTIRVGEEASRTSRFARTPGGAAGGGGRRGGGKSSGTDNDNFLLEDYKTITGEFLNPYDILKVPRNAETSQIKQAYYKLSRRYHPDGHRHRDILPGSCNNLDEVRDHWENIRMSYEILRNPRLRKRYDRHEVLADPGEAMKRAAVDAAVSGVKGAGKGLFNVGLGLGKGLFNVGSMAVQQIQKAAEEQSKNNAKQQQQKPTKQQQQQQQSPRDSAGSEDVSTSQLNVSSGTPTILGGGAKNVTAATATAISS